VLLDEIEKAHPSIFNILLQVYEEGHLTDSMSNIVDFKNCILIMTSNVGARYIQRRGAVGFRTDDEGAGYQEMRDRVLEEVKKTFNPEFLNRINETIVFHSLTDEHLVKIVRLMIEDVNANLAGKDIQVRLDESAYRWMVDETCADRSYGARPLRRAIQKHIEDKLADQLIRGKIGAGDRVEITVGGTELLLQVGKPEEEEHSVAN
jgi:ATP-dependent Clp protease ATP-binding subunit ClpC